MDMNELFSLYFLNMLNDRQAQQLTDWLKSDPEHLEQFIFAASVQSSLYQVMSSKEIQRNLAEQFNDGRIDSFLKALAEHERNAETLVIDPVVEPPEIIRNVRERKQQFRSSRTVSRLSLYTSLVGLAAMLFAVAYVMMNPRQATAPTATITDCIAVRWNSPEVKGSVGDRLFNTDAPLHLREGLVKLKMDDGAEVLIQAPARFLAENSNQLSLEFGKLSSVIPPSAKGFVVRTPSATIVDYGTAFGVLVDSTGRTEAHVFKGEVELRSGPDPIRHGSAQRLQSGLAGIVTAQGLLDDAPRRAEESLFIRDLSGVDREGLVLRHVDLADIVGGGNGFGSGKPEVGIDLQTGKSRDKLDETIDHTRRAAHGYAATPDYAFVDCVFVPGLDGRPTQIASTGLTCSQFGTTSGRFWGYLFNGAFHESAGTDPKPRHTLMLDGRTLEAPAFSVMSVHSNMGVTFDLHQVRRSLPFYEPATFRARVGLSQTIAQYETRNPWAEFWVLLDGQVRLRQPLRMRDGGFDITIPLDSSVRFISLAVTEYTDDIGLDWGVFVNPRLELEVRK